MKSITKTGGLKMNTLHSLIKTKLRLQDNSIAFGPEWTEFSNAIRANLKIIAPDAVYHFNKQPFILFFDFTKPENRERESIIHRQLWCFDKAPVTFFVFDDEVQIYNAFRYQREHDKLEKLNISDYEEQFSFWRLQSGTTWQWLQDTFYGNNLKKDRVDQRLFDNIKETRKKLTEDITPFLDDTFANTVILRLIFIRYLIDRNVKIDDSFITGDTLEEKKQDLYRLIASKDKLNNFFAYLEDRFNGNLFETKEEPEIAQEHLTELSRIFSAHERQLFLFDVFDFSIISVETISGIYESVIDPGKRELNSAIYTPSFIVDYILSQTVDDHLKAKNECRILDPACGSGVFLIQAYRRMVEVNKNKAGEISDARLVKLIQRNLFGIDKDRNALNVTAFSLYVALLDYKYPPEIKRFKLPPLLNTNLFEDDFLDEKAIFNSEAIFRNRSFDFILGNPPWGSKKYNEHLKKYIDRHKTPTARYEIAQTFLARTKDFANPQTKCALIVTSKAFYNTWSKDFVNYFFHKFHISHLFDLSPARRLIFETADNPALIVFYRYAFGKSTLGNIIKHFSVKPNLYLRHFKVLVVEKQDQKEILQKHFIDYEWMLKVALYGNTIDFHFLKKLVSHPRTIKSFIEEFGDIYHGDGIKKLTQDAFDKLSLEQQEKVEPFHEISEIPILETGKINEYYSVVDKDHLPKSDDLYVKSGRHIELYTGERIVFKARPKDETHIIASYVDTDSVYREKTLGIATEKKIKELKTLYGILNSKLYTYYQFLTTSSWGIFYPEILQHEYLMFPYVEIQDKEEFLSLVNRFVDQVKQMYLQHGKTKNISPDELLEQINETINEIYAVNELEKDLIDYVLEVSRYQFQEGKLQKIIKSPSNDMLKKYAEVFLSYFSNVYNENGEYFQVGIYRLPYFVAMKFNIVETPSPLGDTIIFPTHGCTEQTLLQTIAQTVSINEVSEQIFLQKDVKGFEEDFFYIIKPDEYKCWHRAIAHYDLAEFIEAIEKAELEGITGIDK